MQSKAIKQAGYIYLVLVPLIVAGLGFGVGHVSYKIYLPVWLVNVSLMTLASWSIGLNLIRSKDPEKSRLASIAFFLVMSWIIVSLFAGLGPPPETANEWTDTVGEQQLRYFLLVISGVFVAFGFTGLRDHLKSKGEFFYSMLSMTAILIAIPLFIINMLYWGFYLSELFKIQAGFNKPDYPEWFLPVRALFKMIAISEVALTYLATFFLARAMKNAGLLGRTSTLFYSMFSLLAFAIIILSALLGEPFKTLGFAVSIPAFPFLMPYFIGVNFMRKIGNSSKQGNNSQDI